MEYRVAAKLTTDHAVIGGNLDLSPTDKELIAKFYPDRPQRRTLNNCTRPPRAKQQADARSRSGSRASDGEALLLR
jgi:hypothetical protein